VGSAAAITNTGFSRSLWYIILGNGENMKHKADEEFKKNLGKYMKHTNLEIVFTLKNGRRVTFNGKRKIQGDEIIQYFGEEEGVILNMNDIKSADVYAL
jgi:hypothetical protein